MVSRGAVAVEGFLSRQAVSASQEAVASAGQAARVAAGLELILEWELEKVAKMERAIPSTRDLIARDLDWALAKCAEAQTVLDSAQSVLDSAKAKAEELREFQAKRPEKD